MKEPSEDKSKPKFTGRTLVLCFDGTSNQFGNDKNTNVVHLFAMLERNRCKGHFGQEQPILPDEAIKEQPIKHQSDHEQLVYYQTGIGTYTPAGFLPSVSGKLAQLMDEAFAWYLEDHVLGGYRFLMETWKEGDEICLLGFSRGAYTARALAGMLCRVGLLPMWNVEQVPFAYKIFKEAKTEEKIFKENPEDPRGYLSSNFRNTFSREVTVQFVGLWDTVSSVGFIPRSLPNTDENPIVRHVRHAVSLDENRSKFLSNLWSPSKYDSNSVSAAVDPKKVIDRREATIKEVWFAGSHGDVGGGKVPYKAPNALSRITLRWLVREAANNTHILWDDKVLDGFRVLKPKTDEEMIEYMEAEEADALSEYHGAFGWRNVWWALEFLPIPQWVEVLGLRFQVLWPNLFGPRRIRKPTYSNPTLVHSSVKTRLKYYRDVYGRPYKNKAKFPSGVIEWVDEWALPENDR